MMITPIHEKLSNYVIKSINFICKKKVSGVSEISEVTINKRYKKLEQLNIELIPKQILNKYNN